MHRFTTCADPVRRWARYRTCWKDGGWPPTTFPRFACRPHRRLPRRRHRGSWPRQPRKADSTGAGSRARCGASNGSCCSQSRSARRGASGPRASCAPSTSRRPPCGSTYPIGAVSQTAAARSAPGSCWTPSRGWICSSPMSCWTRSRASSGSTWGSNPLRTLRCSRASAWPRTFVPATTGSPCLETAAAMCSPRQRGSCSSGGRSATRSACGSGSCGCPRRATSRPVARLPFP